VSLGWWRVMVAAAAVVCGVTACGSPASSQAGGNPAAAVQGGSAVQGSASSPTSAVASGGAVASARAVAGGAATGGGSSGSGGQPTAQSTPLQYASGTTPAPATATLASSCVRPGGSQRLTVVSKPGLMLSYDVQYADGSDGSKHGGTGQEPVPATGTFVSDWVVAPDTPLGAAICYVSVAGGNESAFRQAGFTVAESC